MDDARAMEYFTEEPLHPGMLKPYLHPGPFRGSLRTPYLPANFGKHDNIQRNGREGSDILLAGTCARHLDCVLGTVNNAKINRRLKTKLCLQPRERNHQHEPSFSKFP